MSVTNCLFFYFFFSLICSALFVSLLSDLDIFVFTKDRFNVMFIIDLCLLILFCFVLFFFQESVRYVTFSSTPDPFCWRTRREQGGKGW